MTFRTIQLKLTARESPLGGGFSVFRALPRRELRRVGGFVFLDHFDAAGVTPAQFDVPPHPHIGLQTVTYLFEGAILHTDSLGFQQTIEPGAANWMTAGRGITHSEQVVETVSRLHGIQSWVGLPQRDRKTDPAFDHYSPAELPLIDAENARIRLLAGRCGESVSPIRTFQELTYLDIAAGGGRLEIEVDPAHELAVYLADGEIAVEGVNVQRFELGKLSDGAAKFVFSAEKPARFILFGGEPLPDPTVIYWNFITDTIGEAKQALLDWEAGKFPAVEKYRKIV